MKYKNASLSAEETRRFKILNRVRESKGMPEFEPEEYKQIVNLFSDKNGNLSGALLKVYEVAYIKYGYRLSSMKIPCKKCKEKKGFRLFRYIKNTGEFFDTCRDCNPSQHSGFYYVDRRRKLKLLKRPTPRMSFKQYRKEKLKYKDSANRFHPRQKDSIQRMVQVFGRKIFSKEKPCKDCGNFFPLYMFPANFNSTYICNRCRGCESRRIAKYIRNRIEKGNSAKKRK
ncbi:hypothetical protein [Leptospira andrefontaineae]|uniref:Uncharacterized protein n=1 Tax=Leptospira andrefontaineae TaxID=2484976 RepID=A0A4R9H6J0_9LEPT|nr:hypothetical protein [Leptospira andrefontaineae]TGK41210.1 hypothetical protein EHO65_07195 [Leptospira andrefontaineae]